MEAINIQSFEHWRDVARSLVAAEASPDSVQLLQDDGQRSLFGASIDVGAPSVSVPPKFIELARSVSHHRDPARWNLLYRCLWRLTHAERHLMEQITDDDVRRIETMEKEIRRDVHKMKAFVRFRKVEREGEEHFIAWHRPDHRIVQAVAPFFARRFRAMNWAILTPDESVVWDQNELKYGPGVPRGEAPSSDELEDLWRTYYGSIFNPARVKIRAMKSEMPVRHWPTLPETEIIADLLHEAPRRVEEMISNREGFDQTAAHYLAGATDPPRSISELSKLAEACQACDLHRDATQIVFGTGPSDARLVIIGEQPGDQEDRLGQPFVGPAGKVLDEALAEAGIDRQHVYVTNVVKHFKHTESTTPRGKRRLHQKPDSREIRCCKPWFDAEWSLLSNPAVLICLGVTAASAIIDPAFRMTKDRGRFFPTDQCPHTIATWHPSAILRVPDAEAAAARRQQLVGDLGAAALLLQSEIQSEHRG